MGKSVKRTTVGDNIEKLRNSLHLNQEEMAEKLGITRSSYAKYETKITPPLNVILKISKVFNISVDELIGNNYNDDNNNAPIDYNNLLNGTSFRKVKFGNYTNYKVGEEDAIFITEDEYDIILRLRDLSINQRDTFVDMLKNVKKEL